jgi:hypothetical protein
VVECANGDGSPPPELLFYWWYGAGTPDEEYSQVYRAQAAGNIYGTVKRYRGLKGKEIHNMTDSERRMIKSLRDTGLL